VVKLSDIRRFEGPEPSNLELFRAIEAHRIDTRERLKALDDRMTNALVSRDVWAAVNQALEDRVDALYVEKAETYGFRRNMTLAVVTILATSLATLLTTLIHVHG
jgi:hypothetical protein